MAVRGLPFHSYLTAYLCPSNLHDLRLCNVMHSDMKSEMGMAPKIILDLEGWGWGYAGVTEWPN